jgi:hypothetical protein
MSSALEQMRRFAAQIEELNRRVQDIARMNQLGAEAEALNGLAERIAQSTATMVNSPTLQAMHRAGEEFPVAVYAQALEDHRRMIERILQSPVEAPEYRADGNHFAIDLPGETSENEPASATPSLGTR